MEYLKRGQSEDERARQAAKVSDIVARSLETIEQGGDAAVREMSEKFDNWSPPSFRMKESDIEHLVNSLSRQDLHDIRFAQEQVRNFARIQRESMHDV